MTSVSLDLAFVIIPLEIHGPMRMFLKFMAFPRLTLWGLAVPLQGGYRPPINPPLQSVLLHLRAFLAPLEPPYGEAKRTALKTLIVITPKTSLNTVK